MRRTIAPVQEFAPGAAAASRANGAVPETDGRHAFGWSAFVFLPVGIEHSPSFNHDASAACGGFFDWTKRPLNAVAHP